jgi:NADH-quinone oxidoreductase subunit L
MYAIRPALPAQMSRTCRPIYLFMLNKLYFDGLYDFLFVRPAFAIGRGFWKGGDGAIIDGYGPDGIAAVARGVARRFSFLQSGYLYHYAFAMLIGVAIFVTWYVVRMG